MHLVIRVTVCTSVHGSSAADLSSTEIQVTYYVGASQYVCKNNIHAMRDTDKHGYDMMIYRPARSLRKK